MDIALLVESISKTTASNLIGPESTISYGEEKGYIFYPGKGPLLGKVMHFANIGTISKEDVEEFCDTIQEVIKDKPIEY